MSKNMAREESESLDRVASETAKMVPISREFQKIFSNLNHNGRLEWRVRVALRDLEAAVSGVEDQAYEVLERVGTETSENLIEDFWGPFDE